MCSVSVFYFKSPSVRLWSLCRFVSKFVPRNERVKSGPNQNYTNLYVKNFGDAFTDETLKNLFSKYGHVSSAVVMKDEQNKSRGFGFVSFDSHEAAKAAEEGLNSTVVLDKTIYVGRAMKKHERQQELRRVFEQKRKERQQRYQGVNLYIKNLEEDFDDERLREEFKKYGTITSAKVCIVGRKSVHNLSGVHSSLLVCTCVVFVRTCNYILLLTPTCFSFRSSLPCSFTFLTCHLYILLHS